MRLIFILTFSLISTFCSGKEIKVLGSDELVDATNFAECVSTNYDIETGEYSSTVIYVNLMKPTLFTGGKKILDDIFIRHDCIIDSPETCFMNIPQLQDSDSVAARRVVLLKKNQKVSDNFHTYDMSSSSATIGYDTLKKKFVIDQNDSESLLVCDVRLRHLR